ncbi:MAG TPA: TonB family protein [Terracidiphilus sp.]|nr:TonB family protein [Terracidiphilus sp.]
MSTSVQEPVSEPSSSRVVSIALIGPNEAHRKVVASALAGAPNRRFREFIDYPARLSEIPKILEQGFSVVMIDVDSDESYALKIVEGFAAAGNVMIMAYSQRNDPDLVANCTQAGAREFLPLPGGTPSLTGPDPVQPKAQAAARPEAPKPAAEPLAATRPAQAVPVTEPPQEARPARPTLVHAEETPAIESAYRPQSPLPTYEMHAPVPEAALPESEAREPLTEAPWQAPSRFDEPAPQAPRTVPSAPVIANRLRASAEPEALTKAQEAGASQSPVTPGSEPANEFEAWDTAHLRFTQAASTKQPDSRMRPTSPHELFARSRKNEEESPRPESLAPGRQPELLSRAQLPPDLVSRSERPKPEDALRITPPMESAPPRAQKEPPPLPPEMFLKHGADTSAPVEPESAPGEIFETAKRQVYKPTPQEMMFSSLATEERDDEGKNKRGGMIWAVMAATAGMLGCVAFLFFFMHPGKHAAAAPVAPVQTQPVETPQPASSEPDVFDKEFSTPDPATATGKPSAGARDDDSADASSRTPQVSSQMMDQQLAAQAKLGANIKKPVPVEEAPPSGFTPGAIESSNGVPGSVFSGASAKVVPGGAAISGGVAEGMLLHRTPPQYPNIARTARVEGNVVLGATITKTGTITNLHVISGPGMLREAAEAAVRTWRYRPYMLDNQPVDVDTTITVNFTLGK